MRAAIIAPRQMPVAAAIALESAARARGQPFRLCASMVISAVIVAGNAGNASAGPLTPFRFEAQAHRHCPQMWPSSSISGSRATIQSGNDDMPAPSTEALCVGRKRAAAAIVTRCPGCASGPAKRG
jgi:hypothetical protein